MPIIVIDMVRGYIDFVHIFIGYNAKNNILYISITPIQVGLPRNHKMEMAFVSRIGRKTGCG